MFDIAKFVIEIKNNSQNQYCLKNIAESDSFQNQPSMGETVKNVVLPLIIELLSKKNIHNYQNKRKL